MTHFIKNTTLYLVREMYNLIVQSDCMVSNKSDQVGSHACKVYRSNQELTDLIVPFFIHGLTNHEKCVYTSDTYTKADIINIFSVQSFDLIPYIEREDFLLFTSLDIYTKNGAFNVDTVLSGFTDFCEQALHQGYKGFRVSGEAEWALDPKIGMKQLLAYESRVNTVISPHPITGLCLYNQTKFSFPTLFNLLRVHPELYIDDARVKSPYYISSDVYEALEQDTFTQELYEHLLSSIKQDAQEEQKTKTEHNAHIVELERMNNAMVGRELKMIELKAQIAKLEKDAISKPL